MKQELLFHSNQDQLSSNFCVGVCMGGVSAPLSRIGLQEMKQELLFHSSQDQLSFQFLRVSAWEVSRHP